MNQKIHASVVLVFLQLFTLASLAAPGGSYPKTPISQSTPGALCRQPDARRYPEQIAYCNRNVDGQLRFEIIESYDRQFGYRIKDMDRAKFKIDHLIPLCAGGSNERENLWPQHESVYLITDPLEPLICEKMAAGRLKQAEAVRLILAAKMDLTKVQQIINYVSRK